MASSLKALTAGNTSSARRRVSVLAPAPLPRWPFTAMLALYPLWWALGFGTMAWIPLALCMAVLLIRRGNIRVPRGFGLWLLFMVLMLVSVIGIDSTGRFIGFVYRAMLYIAVTVVFIYVYNARERLTTRYALGVVTLFWLYAVLGGFAGVYFPTFSFHTPLGYVLPEGLKANEVVREMIEPRLTQYDPEGWFDLDPRPSAPFLYTNQWGNVYSLTLPMVIAYLASIPRTLKYWLVALAVLVSFVPAILTLNRGMFLGLGVAALYLLIRFLLAGRVRETLLLCAVGIVLAVAAVAMDLVDRVSSRVETSSSTEDRADLYEETITRTLQSPLFGYGAPRPSLTEGVPSVGTQGHLWMVMFSHGFPALVCFVLALVWLVIATLRTRDTTMLIMHTVQLVILVEIFYYGVLPNGLILSFTAAALALRGQPPNIRALHR
ncbi:MAG: O-antigen ligase family protein [Leucobacter sp.]